MGRIQFDAALVADGYDVNRNGLVSDDLRVEQPSVDSDGDATVSTAELARSLERDAVEVTEGAIRAARVRSYPVVADIPRLATIAEAISAGKRVGNRYEPHDSEIEQAEDGSRHEVVVYDEANATLKRMLKSIIDAASTGEDPIFSSVREIAQQGLGAWWHDEERRYQDMYRALEKIEDTMGDPPLQPEASVRAANDAVLRAQSRFNAAQTELGTPQAQQQRLADAKTLLDAEKSKKGLMKWFAQRKITKLEAAVSQLKAFQADSVYRQLSETARKSYELSLSGSAAETLGQARHLDALSRALRGQTAAIAGEADRVLSSLTYVKQELNT